MMEDYSPAMKARIKKELNRLVAVGAVDRVLLPYLKKINKLPHIVTWYSCWGHPERMSMKPLLNGVPGAEGVGFGYLVIQFKKDLYQVVYRHLKDCAAYSRLITEVENGIGLNPLTNRESHTVFVGFIGGEYAHYSLSLIIKILKNALVDLKRRSLLLPEKV